ncbi:MAG: hypothetical protein EOM59_06515 [Clostridia bacterium]|nr:hypothetical protein [Clostridia bacterium]
MTDKRKKILLITGCSVACLALLFAIGSQFYNPDTIKDSTISKQSGEESLKIDIPAGEQSGADSNAALPDQTDLADQSIQSDPTKPEATPEQLTDPAKRPDGEKVDGTPQATDHNNVTTPETTAPASTGDSQAGETKDGMIYVPGFGWVKDSGEENVGTYAEDMYENGNKIGNMD